MYFYICNVSALAPGQTSEHTLASLKRTSVYLFIQHTCSSYLFCAWLWGYPFYGHLIKTGQQNKHEAVFFKLPMFLNVYILYIYLLCNPPLVVVSSSKIKTVVLHQYKNILHTYVYNLLFYYLNQNDTIIRCEEDKQIVSQVVIGVEKRTHARTHKNTWYM